jgi:hypothetical protein
MAIGDSGRIVLEIEPQLKRELYSSLALESKTLKEWFVTLAEQYVRAHGQSELFAQQDLAKYSVRKQK